MLNGGGNFSLTTNNKMNYDINELKAKHGKKLIETTIKTTDDETFVFVLKKPTKTVIEAIADMKEAKAKPSAYLKVMIANTVIAGDMDAVEDGEVYQLLMDNVKELFKKGTSTLKKL